MQEVLARAYRRWARITASGQPEPYLRKAVLNEYLSWRRRRSSTEALVPVLPERPADGLIAEGVASRDEMWGLLAELPRTQRAVLVLRYYVDLPDAEIAELVGCAVPTVRVQAFRALAKLRAVLIRREAVGATRD